MVRIRGPRDTTLSPILVSRRRLAQDWLRADGAMKHYPVVVFDLDGTLLRGTTVSMLLAQWLGQADAIAELERASQCARDPNRVVADSTAGWLAGQSTAEAWRVQAEGRWIDGMAETFQALRAAGWRASYSARSHGASG